MEDIFDIRNNFIPKKAQEEKSGKFGRELGRNGRMIPPAEVELGALPTIEIGTQSIVSGEDTPTRVVLAAGEGRRK